MDDTEQEAVWSSRGRTVTQIYLKMKFQEKEEEEKKKGKEKKPFFKKKKVWLQG